MAHKFFKRGSDIAQNDPSRVSENLYRRLKKYAGPGDAVDPRIDPTKFTDEELVDKLGPGGKPKVYLGDELGPGGKPKVYLGDDADPATPVHMITYPKVKDNQDKLRGDYPSYLGGSPDAITEKYDIINQPLGDTSKTIITPRVNKDLITHIDPTKFTDAELEPTEEEIAEEVARANQNRDRFFF